MIHTIVTHPGGAHKDDVLAVCILIALHGARVFRRDPTPDELADPAVAIVDVGGSHDAALSNFDHHHFPREHEPTCALSLLLMHLELYDDALKFCDWLEPAEWFDSRGPKRTAEWLGVPRRAISQLNSPVDASLIRRFAKATALAAGDPVYEFMRIVGEDMLEDLHQARKRINFVAEHVQRWSLDQGADTIEALYLPRTEPAAAEPSTAVHNYIRAEGLGDTIAAIVYPDRRGPGYGISRFEDHPKLDFCQVQDEPDVHFAHISGFVCKTTATEPERLKSLVKQGWID
ncbi:MAG: MYG1 family protein [Proteobacteria bacterium]|nr:MYG1 family protein [Pseudomonadota bacterium]